MFRGKPGNNCYNLPCNQSPAQNTSRSLMQDQLVFKDDSHDKIQTTNSIKQIPLNSTSDGVILQEDWSKPAACYFGTDKQQAMKRYLEQASYPHAARLQMLNYIEVKDSNMRPLTCGGLKSKPQRRLADPREKVALDATTLRDDSASIRCGRVRMQFLSIPNYLSDCKDFCAFPVPPGDRRIA